jgi:hypothetical protein
MIGQQEVEITCRNCLLPALRLALGWHEALNRTHCIQDSFYEHVATHPVIQENKELSRLTTKAQDALMELYQTIGALREDDNQ